MAEVARLFIGIGGSFVLLSVIKLATRWFRSDQLALVTGVSVTMAMLGGFLAQTPFVILKQHIGWRHALGLGRVVWACNGFDHLYCCS